MIRVLRLPSSASSIPSLRLPNTRVYELTIPFAINSVYNPPLVARAARPFSASPKFAMPPKKAASSAKRKAPSSSPASDSKRAKTTPVTNKTPQFKDSHEEEDYGIILRRYYPPEMTNERCLAYNKNELPRPIEQLDSAIAETSRAREAIDVQDAVVFWFKADIRMKDNKGLHLASEKAKSKGVPLIGIYIVSPEDFEAHSTAAVRVDFALRSLEVLKADLAAKDIPLYVETVEKRKAIPQRIMELCEKWGAKHLFANIEYEIDELRREARMTRKCLEKGISMNVFHDTCVVAPGELHTGADKQYAVYSPWYRSWVRHLNEKPAQLDLFPEPEQNPASARQNYKDLFDHPIPEAPANKTLTPEEKKRFRTMWPPGENEAQDRLVRFLDQKVGRYKDLRNLPAANATAMMSVHFSAGTLSTRSAVRRARDVNSTKKLDGGNGGIVGWISEVAWRDFYKHVLVHWPYVCMNKPFKPEYTNIKWEYNESHFTAWRTGHTGFPIVDAAMRQLNHMGYMHNRCRMIVASFLAKDLLLDWRMGERYFMEHLIDGDFASNNGGWGFSASTGVDPQPYFRIFNPLLQSEKFDEEGEYIRKWVPELRDVQGKKVHDPYGRGAGDVARRNGYPEPVVDHKFCRDRALARYKEGIGRSTA